MYIYDSFNQQYIDRVIWFFAIKNRKATNKNCGMMEYHWDRYDGDDLDGL